jgi:ATP-dependent 26S proteasome regulatory subunit
MVGSMDDWEGELDAILRAGAPLIWLESEEEPRALAALERHCAAAGRPLSLWSCARGVHSLRSTAVDGRTQDPSAALDTLARMDARPVFAMLDAHPFLSQALLVRRLRELRGPLAAGGKSLAFVAPVPCPAADLRGDLARVTATPPSRVELSAVIDELAAGLRAPVSAADRATLANSARGMRTDVLALALRRAIARCGALDQRALVEVRRERDRAIADGALLESVDAASGLEHIGGLDALKRWLELRAHALREEARSFGVDAPRGLFLAGVQGGGKSTCARAVASMWGLPLLRLDVGRVFHGLVGASEANVRSALAQAESAAPCVLWIDEIGRAFAGAAHGGDAGTSSRVFGFLLSWLQERAATVFVVATANDVTSLPPELLRKGRFDEVFFVDLPTRVERSEIARIHLARRGRDGARFDLDAVAAATDGFSGAELEQCVVTALLYAFSERRELSQADLARAARETVPLARTARESLDSLRRWAAGRARPASSLRDGVDTRVAL